MSNGRLTTTFARLIESAVLEIGDGYRAKNEELGGDGPIFLRAGHVRDTHIDFEGVERFRRARENAVTSKLARAGDTVITTKGNSTGRTTFVDAGMPPFVYSPHLSYWRSRDPDRLHPLFLRYWARGAEFQSQLEGMKVSTDMAPYLSLLDQRRLRITLPSPAEQAALGALLACLDDKIALNRRMSRTIETLTAALFRSWFVDFEPVVAKLDGRRAPGVPKVGHAAMPDGFSDVDGTPMPDGWTCGSVYDLAEVVYGLPFASRLFNGERLGRPLLRIRDLPTGDPQVFTTEQQPREAVIRAGDIVVGMDGEFRAHLWRGPDALLNQRVCQFRPRPGVPAAFVLFSIAGPLAQFERANVGTTVNHLGKRDIDTIRIVAPARAVLASFGEVTTPLLARLVANDAENRALEGLRDTLLPQLLTGAASLRHAERAAAAV